MRKLLTHALAFLLGIGSMFAVSRYQQARSQKMWKEWESRRALMWQDQGSGASESYYAEKFPVPLPRNLDFSSNAWQRLNYWQMFARSYQFYHYPMGSHDSVTTTVPLDPWEAAERFEDGPDATRPSSLAMEAYKRIERGEKFNEVVKWVSESYQYSTNKALVDHYITVRGGTNQ